MSDEKILIDCNPQDFIIKVSPVVNLGIIIADDMFFDEEDYANLLHFCRMITSTVPMMEEMKTFRELINDYALNELDREEQDVVKPRVLSRKDNVVRVSFNPKLKEVKNE